MCYLKGGENKIIEEYPLFSSWLWHILSIACSRQYKWFGLDFYMSYAKEEYVKIMSDNDLYKYYKNIYESGEGITITRVVD
jgi:hypothetical protein